MHFEMSSAIYFNLDQSKMLSSGNGLKLGMVLQVVVLVFYFLFPQTFFSFLDTVLADPEGGTGGLDPPWNFGKNVLIGFVKWYSLDIAQHLCKIQS